MDFIFLFSLSDAIPDGKPRHTFPGIAPSLTQFLTENRVTLFLELLSIKKGRGKPDLLQYASAANASTSVVNDPEVL
ncbi:hypothetical protein ACVDG8_003770 [Mesorhizobium sp. ORM8.1]